MQPLPETVALVEDIVVEYVTDLVSFLYAVLNCFASLLFQYDLILCFPQIEVDTAALSIYCYCYAQYHHTTARMSNFVNRHPSTLNLVLSCEVLKNERKMLLNMIISVNFILRFFLMR